LATIIHNVTALVYWNDLVENTALLLFRQRYLHGKTASWVYSYPT